MLNENFLVHEIPLAVPAEWFLLLLLLLPHILYKEIENQKALSNPATEMRNTKTREMRCDLSKTRTGRFGGGMLSLRNE